MSLVPWNGQSLKSELVDAFVDVDQELKLARRKLSVICGNRQVWKTMYM